MSLKNKLVKQLQNALKEAWLVQTPEEVVVRNTALIQTNPKTMKRTSHTSRALYWNRDVYRESFIVMWLKQSNEKSAPAVCIGATPVSLYRAQNVKL